MIKIRIILNCKTLRMMWKKQYSISQTKPETLNSLQTIYNDI